MFECLRPALFEMSSGARTCLKVSVFEYLAAIRYITQQLRAPKCIYHMPLVHSDQSKWWPDQHNQIYAKG